MGLESTSRDFWEGLQSPEDNIWIYDKILWVWKMICKEGLYIHYLCHSDAGMGRHKASAEKPEMHV
jgi:hypothetical protein